MMQIRTAPNRKETQSIKWIWAYIQDSKTYTESICSRISQHEDRISDTKDRLHVLIIRKSSCGTVPWDINPADSRSCKQLIGKPGIQFSGRSNHPANLRSSVQFPPTKKRKNKKLIGETEKAGGAMHDTKIHSQTERQNTSRTGK